MFYRLLMRFQAWPGVSRLLCRMECGENDVAIYTCDRCR